MTGRKFSITYGGRRRLSCIIKGTVLMIEGDTMKDMIHYIAMLPAIAIAISIFNYAQARIRHRDNGGEIQSIPLLILIYLVFW